MSAGTVAPRLLVAEDEDNQRTMLRAILERAGYEVETAADGKEALARLEASRFALLLTDQRMARLDGLALLDRARELYPEMPVVLMTAYGSVGDAVAAMKRGASDYLTKPFEKDELLLVLERALRARRLEAEVEELRGVLRLRIRLGNLVGGSPRMQELFALVERVAPTDVPVLIRGESGTGKELVARALHQASTRAQGPFVGLNCAAVPESLLESEFFGHERGSFTGADRTREGRFEQAQGGTLFLDEIGAMRVDLQAKLLRAIQEHEVQRIGGSRPIAIDVRILAATCEDLEEAIREKRFRQDLFYRLSVVPIELPPLRERKEDIPLLVEQFLRESGRKFAREPLSLAPEVMDRLQRHPWPGNVRELQNCIERMVLLAGSSRLTLADLPPAVRDGVEAIGAGGLVLPVQGVNMAELERSFIAQALERSGGALGPAAKLLGISYKTLQYRVQKHGLGRPGGGVDGPGEDEDPQV